MFLKLAAILVLSAVAQAQNGWFCRAGVDIGVSCPCGGVGDGGPSGCPNSVYDVGAYLVGGGQTSVSADSFSVIAGRLPAGSATAALLVQGSAAIQPGVFGDGVRCVGGTTIRIGLLHPLSGNDLAYGVSGDVPISVRGQVPTSGGYRCYQVWYRNAAPFCMVAAFNMTNALGVTWTP